MKIDGQNFEPKDWHIDLSTDYVTHVPTTIGFYVSFLPRAFDTDGLSSEDFIAEPVHFPEWGAVPSEDELLRLCRIAAALYAARLSTRLHRTQSHSRRRFIQHRIKEEIPS